eukprot:scaffold107193_cov43-Prasinocladus_malaysianus.AAC.1
MARLLGNASLRFPQHFSPCSQRKTLRSVPLQPSATQSGGQGNNKPNAYSKVYPRKATWEGIFGTGKEGDGGQQRRGTAKPPWESLGQLNEANLVWNNEL